jgi:beta-glucanase (GH16 family)
MPIPPILTQPNPKYWRPAAPQQTEVPPPFDLTPDWRRLSGDDFTTSNLDMNKWWTRYIYNNGTLDFLNDEWERYREDGNHLMDGGLLELTALPHTGEFWPSGMIRSKDLYPIYDGNAWYFECRAKIPKGKGVWPAFWLAACERVPGDDATALWPPEIDIMEIVNNEIDDTTSMLHCGGVVWDWDHNPQQYAATWATEGWNSEWSYWAAPFDFADGFHNFGLFYQRPHYTIYVDRQPIVTGVYDWVADDRAPIGAHVLCNLAIGGSWAGRHGVDEAAFPQALNVAYIHVYQRLAQSTIGHDLLPV